ncbi:hypothetical protein ACIRBX_18790 [Kitasatospora sp. NPDC096147]|uniref:hypothetical protein n=1 Tax=Kitasatospora sp. NPDC096147 TaxID=3364093 RepID=UPI0037F7274E
MGDRANIVVVREDGTKELYRSGWAVELDLDLLAGPDALLASLPGLKRDGWWLDDLHAQAGVVVDLARRVLAYFVGEGPSVELRHREATLALLAEVWPGWRVRWLHQGQADLLALVGRDPTGARAGVRRIHPEELLAPDDEELADEDPNTVVITLPGGRSHVTSAVADHPVREGPALLARLADAPRHGVVRLPAASGLHLDPKRHRLGWWCAYFTPEADLVPALWPGWTVEFWRDDWRRQVRASAGLFAPAPADSAGARAAVLARAAERVDHRARHDLLVARTAARR